MKALVFISLLALSSAFGAVQDFTPQSEVDLPGLPWKSVGLVLIQSSKAHNIYHTGFFISENRFVVPDSPFAKTKTGACEKETWILTGQRTVKADFELKTLKPSHRCTKVLRSDRLRGYAVWETEAFEKDTKVEPLSLLTDSHVERGHLDLETEHLTFIGFSFGTNGAVLKVETEGRYETVSGPFASQTVDPGIWDHRWDWSSMKVGFETGMQGGPVFVRSRGKWLVAGLAVSQAEVAGKTANPILSTGFVRLTRFFGETLEAEDE